MKQAFDPIPEDQVKYLENRGYKFREELRLPKLLVPWSKQSWYFTGGMLGLLYGLRASNKRNGYFYSIYSIGMIALLLSQYHNMKLLDRYHEPKAHRKGLSEMHAPITQSALKEVLDEYSVELADLHKEIKQLEQSVLAKGLQLP